MCLKRCPDFYFAFLVNYKCIKTCPISFYGDRVNNICRNSTNPCPSGFISDSTSLLCICQTGYFNYYEKIC